MHFNKNKRLFNNRVQRNYASTFKNNRSSNNNQGCYNNYRSINNFQGKNNINHPRNNNFNNNNHDNYWSIHTSRCIIVLIVLLDDYTTVYASC